MAYKKIGVAGPVGSGKTALIEAVTREMASSYSIGVITNDIYTKEDAEFLAKNSVMPRDRITGVETGGCPHTAIREDASMNLSLIHIFKRRFVQIRLQRSINIMFMSVYPLCQVTQCLLAEQNGFCGIGMKKISLLLYKFCNIHGFHRSFQ